MNMAGRLIALRRGGKAALLGFNFRWLLAHDMTIFLFQMSHFRYRLVITAGWLDLLMRKIIAPGRFAVWHGAIL
jgi:hypothetical protein